jgi:hypothetical protein
MSDNYSSFYPNLQQVVWTWNESYRTNKSFYLLNFDVELQLEKLIITVKVYESKLNGDEKELTTYITHMTDINFIKLIEQLNAFKQQGLAQSAEAKAISQQIALGNQQIARMLADQKLDAAKNKPLSASLQKSEDEDLQAINSYKATQKELYSPIQALTPDPVTKKPKLELGPVQNLRYQAANLTGDSNEASRAYADLQSAVKNAVNLKVSAEKGVQTDKDVLRFADALISASGKNDTKATLEALKKFNESIATAQENTVKLIDQRRKSQGVSPLFGDTNRNVNVNY